jgi:hypothetical protein
MPKVGYLGPKLVNIAYWQFANYMIYLGHQRQAQGEPKKKTETGEK